MITFDPTLTNQQLIEQLTAQLATEASTFDYDTLECTVEQLQLKGLSTEQLVEVFKVALANEQLVNNDLLININILVNGYNTLDDSLFESPVIAFTSLEQLLDVKLALHDQIKDFQTRCTYWFIACLKSMHKVEYTYLDQTVNMPFVFRKFISASNLLTLSQIMSKAGNVQLADLPLVKNAYPVVSELASNMVLSNKLFEALNFNDKTNL